MAITQNMSQGNEFEPSELHTVRLDRRHFAMLGVLAVAFIWSYWTTIVSLTQSWESIPDYSHGYFVVPIAAWFLWVRRETRPTVLVPAVFSGFALVALSVLIRYIGARFFLVPIDGWSILIWVSGVVAAIAGLRFLWWSLPSIAFLWFMVPMPFRVEQWFRQPLQYLATNISTASLVILGQPALAEGNTIRIGEAHFNVEEACSGLRIFVGIVALAFAYVVVVRRSWLIKGLLLASVLPVTLIANSVRIVATCLLYLYVSGEASKRFSHDIAGFVMIPFAAILLGLVLWYLGKLIREVRVEGVGHVIRETMSDELRRASST